MAYTDNLEPAPRVSLDYPSDHGMAIADISAATVDLTTVSGAGKHAAQCVRFNNDTAASLDAVVVFEQPKQSDGTAGVTQTTFTVNAGQQYEPPQPIKAIIHTGSGALSALVFWWNGNRTNINK